MDMEIIRSRRKTLCAEIRQGRLILRVPLRATRAEIESFLAEKRNWIEVHLAKSKAQEEARKSVPPLSQAEIRSLAQEAKTLIPDRVAYFARRLGVTYGRITIRCQKTRWGSCSSNGNLNFNCLLMLTPPEVIDSVVVHELCHLKEMNHSARFYAEVRRVYPEYDRWNRWLKEHGPIIMERMKMAENGR